MKYRIYYQAISTKAGTEKTYWGVLTFTTRFNNWPWTETQIKNVENQIKTHIEAEAGKIQVLLLLNIVPLKDE